MNKLDLIATRDYMPSDQNFILATWLRGLFYGNEWFGSIEKDTYFLHYQEIVKQILNKPGIVIKVACLKDDPDVILSYAVYEGSIVHWVQTKVAWRNIGLCRSLVPKHITTISHITKIGRTLLYRNKLTFNPFVL